METNFFNGDQKVAFLRNICRTLRELKSFIAGIQMKSCIFYKGVLPEEQRDFYPDELGSSKGML